MSFISRLWKSLRNPVRYIGRDLQGNTYHEAPSPNDPSRPKRFVQYKEEGDVWNHIAGQKRLPVQWTSWLTYTRAHPPTVEELQADMERQQRVLANVARIQERERAEEEEKLRIRQRDAQQALIDAASVHAKREAPQTSVTGEQASASPAASAPAAEPTPASESAPTKTSNVLPPTFLTPSSPRKAKNPGKFRLPPMDWNAEGASSQEATLTQASGGHSKTSEEKKDNGQSIPYAPSKPVSETESWTPRAVKRGQ